MASGFIGIINSSKRPNASTLLQVGFAHQLKFNLDMVPIPQIITEINKKAVTEKSKLNEAARDVQSKC